MKAGDWFSLMGDLFYVVAFAFTVTVAVFAHVPVAPVTPDRPPPVQAGGAARTQRDML